MATVIPDAQAEIIVEIWTDVDVFVSFHTADPGKTGADECTGLDRVEIDTATGWTAFVADGSTGGRLRDNDALLDFGTTTAAETLTHMGLWTAITAGTFLGGAELTAPIVTNIGDGVTFPIGNLDIVGAGFA